MGKALRKRVHRNPQMVTSKLPDTGFTALILSRLVHTEANRERDEMRKYFVCLLRLLSIIWITKQPSINIVRQYPQQPPIFTMLEQTSSGIVGEEGSG